MRRHGQARADDSGAGNDDAAAFLGIPYATVCRPMRVGPLLEAVLAALSEGYVHLGILRRGRVGSSDMEQRYRERAILGRVGIYPLRAERAGAGALSRGFDQGAQHFADAPRLGYAAARRERRFGIKDLADRADAGLG